MQDLKQMPPEQKKQFFSMDLAERMIRVEQHISSTFNKPVTYEQTEYFKSLSPQQKTEFKNYLKNKNKKKFMFFLFLFVLPVFIFSILNINFTGNVISENSGHAGLIISWIAIGIIAVAVLVYIIELIFKRRSHKTFKRHSRVLQEIYLRKKFHK
jgi:uncharacterized membrane protein (DUF485 family)